MPHVVLLGDSIFDNASYVPGGPSVIEHLGKELPPGWRATLLAVDGAVVDGVSRQLDRLPGDATHLVVSAGGNDALGFASQILDEPASSVAEALAGLDTVRAAFRSSYRRMIDRLRATGLPLVGCTIYDAVPGLRPAERSGLALFNEVILFELARALAPIIDLRLVCTDPGDYSGLSPIEPSALGGGKIARLIRKVVTDPPNDRPTCRILW